MNRPGWAYIFPFSWWVQKWWRWRSTALGGRGGMKQTGRMTGFCCDNLTCFGVVVTSHWSYLPEVSLSLLPLELAPSSSPLASSARSCRCCSFCSTSSKSLSMLEVFRKSSCCRWRDSLSFYVPTFSGIEPEEGKGRRKWERHHFFSAQGRDLEVGGPPLGPGAELCGVFFSSRYDSRAAPPSGCGHGVYCEPRGNSQGKNKTK